MASYRKKVASNAKKGKVSGKKKSSAKSKKSRK